MLPINNHALGIRTETISPDLIQTPLLKPVYQRFEQFLVPRGPMSRSVPRYDGKPASVASVPIQDVNFRKTPLMRQFWGGQNQASPRRNSSFDFRPQSVISSRAVELQSAQRSSLVEVCKLFSQN